MKKLPEVEVQRLADLLRRAGQALKAISETAEALAIALDDSVRIRRALHRARIPADFAEILETLSIFDVGAEVQA